MKTINNSQLMHIAGGAGKTVVPNCAEMAQELKNTLVSVNDVSNTSKALADKISALLEKYNYKAT
jgi:tetraacyldisaccharide-1-P 4'-kinase